MTILFALLLYFVDKEEKKIDISLVALCRYFFIGFMQTLAIIPGVSRAGVVITTALFIGFNRNDSIKISFLLSIPAIFMASTYQAMQLISVDDIVVLREYFLGFLLSFVFSYVTIKLFTSTINKITFSPYVVYRIILGTILLII